MNFNAGGGNNDILRPEGAVNIGVVSMTDMAWQNRQRIENPPELAVMIRVTSPNLSLKLNGVTYTARKHGYHGWVIDNVPVRLLNELAVLDIPLPDLGGKKKAGNSARLSFEVVQELPGGTTY
jgi:hypothetical protein